MTWNYFAILLCHYFKIILQFYSIFTACLEKCAILLRCFPYNTCIELYNFYLNNWKKEFLILTAIQVCDYIALEVGVIFVCLLLKTFYVLHMKVHVVWWLPLMLYMQKVGGSWPIWFINRQLCCKSLPGKQFEEASIKWFFQHQQLFASHGDVILFTIVAEHD